MLKTTLALYSFISYTVDSAVETGFSIQRVHYELFPGSKRNKSWDFGNDGIHLQIQGFISSGIYF